MNGESGEALRLLQPDTEALIAFVRDRLAEEECQADLFHELTCTVAEGRQRMDRPDSCLETCSCPAAARLSVRAHTLRDALRHCEELLRSSPDHPRWPLGPVFAENSLRALALPYELHPAWRDHWYP